MFALVGIILFNELEVCIAQRKISLLPEELCRQFGSLTNKSEYVPIRYLQPNFPQLLCLQKSHDQEDCMELFQCQAPYMHKNIKSILMLLDKIINIYGGQNL